MYSMNFLEVHIHILISNIFCINAFYRCVVKFLADVNLFLRIVLFLGKTCLGKKEKVKILNLVSGLWTTYGEHEKGNFCDGFFWFKVT